MYLQKYLSGQEKEVWDEIEGVQIAKLSGEELDDIESVCKEAMKRVKNNLEVIINTLRKASFDFSIYPDGEKHFFIYGLENPGMDVDSKISEIESIAGYLPLTIKHFWKEVGSVSLVGSVEGWEEYSDPLFVASVDDNLELLREWSEFRQDCEEHAEDPFKLFISPDEDQKDGYEGGMYQNIELPCARVDALVKDAASETSFIDYLREAFEAKGFPGLEEVPEFLKGIELETI